MDTEVDHDAVKMPDMAAAMLTALLPSLEQTGEHNLLPDRYCPDCQGQCLREWISLPVGPPVAQNE